MYGRCNAHLVRTIDHEVALLGVAEGTPGLPSTALVIAAADVLASDRLAAIAETPACVTQ